MCCTSSVLSRASVTVQSCNTAINRLNNAALSDQSTKQVNAVQIAALRTKAINIIENITIDDLQDNDDDGVTNSSNESSSDSTSSLFD